MVQSTAPHHLILGGARSGKSRYAEKITRHHAKPDVNNQSKQLLYIATATPSDKEMAQRIKRHQRDREQDWQLIEEPLDLAEALNNATAEQFILIDCLTLWLSNCLHEGQWDQRKASFIEKLKTSPASVTMVSNEVGSGIIPLGKLSRQFVDEAGWLHQTLATLCTRVTLVVAGLPTHLK